MKPKESLEESWVKFFLKISSEYPSFSRNENSPINLSSDSAVEVKSKKGEENELFSLELANNVEYSSEALNKLQLEIKKWDYKEIILFAIGCDTKYENAVDAFQILFQQIRNDLSNCAFAPHRKFEIDMLMFHMKNFDKEIGISLYHIQNFKYPREFVIQMIVRWTNISVHKNNLEIISFSFQQMSLINEEKEQKDELKKYEKTLSSDVEMELQLRKIFENLHRILKNFERKHSPFVRDHLDRCSAEIDEIIRKMAVRFSVQKEEVGQMPAVVSSHHRVMNVQISYHFTNIRLLTYSLNILTSADLKPKETLKDFLAEGSAKLEREFQKHSTLESSAGNISASSAEPTASEKTSF